MKKDRKCTPETPQEPAWLTCPYCGNQQTDMGKNVACEECGERMPETDK